MPPNAEYVPPSTLGIVPPKTRYKGFKLSADSWLKDKQDTDGAEGLWRIDDGLYDFSEFIDKHPGGRDWVLLTKGTDITEGFHAHHLTTLPYEMKKKYFIRNAKKKRNAPFVFKEDGFYLTLKKEVRKILPTLPKQPFNTSKFIADAVCFFLFTFAILATKYWSYGLGVLAAIFLGFTTIAAHNFLHQKDNLRMYYFQFSLMSVREFRITHVLSHHLHTNTIDDMEISMFEPMLTYLPIEKSPLKKYGQFLVAPLVWITMFHLSMLKRIEEFIHMKLTTYDFSLIALPLAMYIFGGQSFLHTMGMYNFILVLGSLHYGFIGLHAAHHHPEIFHDGDTPRDLDDYDWGLSQLDAVMDRKEISGSHFLVLTNFGDHCLHHLFPTLDHGMLELLYPKFNEILEKYDIGFRMASQWDTIKGGFQQLVRTSPNSNPPNLEKYCKKDK